MTNEMEHTTVTRIKVAQEQVNLLAALLGLVVKSSIGLGALIFLLYATKEHFFYDISSLSAIAILLFIACAFSMLIMVGLLYGAISSLWMVRIFVWLSRFGKREEPLRLIEFLSSKWLTLFSVILFFLMGLLIFVPFSEGESVNLQVPIYFLLSGSYLILLFGREPTPHVDVPSFKRLSTWAAAILVLITLLSIYTPAAGFLLDRTMNFLSFRSGPEQFVALHESSHRKVNFIGEFAGARMDWCELDHDLWLLRKATLVWHGFGATSYLRLTVNPQTSVLIPLPSSEVEPIAGSFPIGRDCPSRKSS